MTNILWIENPTDPTSIGAFREALRVARPSAGHALTQIRPSDRDVLRATIRRESPALVLVVAPEDDPAAARQSLQWLSEEHVAPVWVLTRDAGLADNHLSDGADERLSLPVDVDDVAERLRRLFRGTPRQSATRPVPEFIGQNSALIAELDKIAIVAPSDATVLITGETGTGKELCAQAIHRLSPRHARALVPINCGALPPDLIENELFGHERGAFTGASNGRTGLVREADGGTLFLDEINSLPLTAQVKILRLLQDGTFRALGSTRLQQADLRIVTATNEDLRAAVAAGRFRQDLYFRLNVVRLHLPALRERRDDISLLAEFFVDKYARRTGRRICGISPDGLAALATHSWPGNVRELEHVIEGAVLLAQRSRLDASDFRLGGETPVRGSFRQAKARVVTEFEREYLLSMLREFNGNVTRAATAARKNRRAFWELLRKHAIDPQAFRGADALAVHRLVS